MLLSMTWHFFPKLSLGLDGTEQPASKRDIAIIIVVFMLIVITQLSAQTKINTGNNNEETLCF